MKRAHNITERFGRKIRKLGIKDRGVYFHTRNTLASSIENAGVAENIAQQITSHRKQSLTFGLYSRGVDLDVLAKAVLKQHEQAAEWTKRESEEIAVASQQRAEERRKVIEEAKARGWLCGTARQRSGD